MLRRLGVPSLLVGLVVGLAVGGTAIWAAIPDRATGMITACYPTSGANQGQLSVIDPAAGDSCAAGQATLTWQQQTYCAGFPHPGVDWSIPGSTPGHGCNFANLGFPQPSDATNGNFTNADLDHAVMYGMQSRGANFTGANLTGATVGPGFSNAALRAAGTITGINMQLHDMVRWDMSKLNLSSARLNGNLTSANLSNANLTSASFTNAILTNANFTGANLKNANVNTTGFTNADLRVARGITGIRLSGPARHAVMAGWDFSGLNLSNAIFQYREPAPARTSPERTSRTP